MTSSTRQLPKIRRVVTGHDTNMLAKVLIDGPATNQRSGSASTLIWCSDSMPVVIAAGQDIDDMGARVLGQMGRALR